MTDKQETALAIPVETAEIPPENKAVAELSQNEIAVIRRTYAPTATDAEFKVYLAVCRHRNLNPFKGEVHFIKYGEGDNATMAIVVGIYGLLKIAEKTGNYNGRTMYQWCGRDGKWFDVWDMETKGTPYAARVGVYRKDSDVPVYGIVYWKEAAKYFRDKKSGEMKLSPMWASNPLRMLAKCAEAQAVREACPDVDGIYIAEEFGTTIEHLNREPGTYNESAGVPAGFSPDDICQFGKKWSGTPWNEVDKTYLDWIISNVKDKPDVVARAQWELDRRNGKTEPDITDAPYEENGKGKGETREELVQFIRNQKSALSDETYKTIYREVAATHGFRNYTDPTAPTEGLKDLLKRLEDAVTAELGGDTNAENK